MGCAINWQMVRFEETIAPKYVLNGKCGISAAFPICPIRQLARRADVWFLEEEKELCYDFT